MKQSQIFYHEIFLNASSTRSAVNLIVELENSNAFWIEWKLSNFSMSSARSYLSFFQRILAPVFCERIMTMTDFQEGCSFHQRYFNKWTCPIELWSRWHVANSLKKNGTRIDLTKQNCCSTGKIKALDDFSHNPKHTQTAKLKGQICLISCCQEMIKTFSRRLCTSKS